MIPPQAQAVIATEMSKHLPFLCLQWCGPVTLSCLTNQGHLTLIAPDTIRVGWVLTQKSLGARFTVSTAGLT